MPEGTEVGAAARERLYATIVECTKNSRLAFVVAASGAFYQLAAVTSVTARELLANANKMQLPFVAVSTSLQGFFFLSSILVLALVVHLCGQLLLLASLVGDYVHEYPESIPKHHMLYPWAPLHVMVWWAATRRLSTSERSSEDESAFDIALRIAYTILLAFITTVAFTGALFVVLLVYRNNGDLAGRALIIGCIAATLATGVGTVVEVHCRLRAISHCGPHRVVRIGLPCLLAVVAAWAIGFQASRGQDLARADLSGLDLEGRDFSGADLQRADLTAAKLKDATLRNANMSGAKLNLAILRGADLSGAHMWRASLQSAVLRNAKLTNTDMREARLDWTDFTDARIVCGDWTGARGVMVNFRNASFSHCGERAGLTPPAPAAPCVSLVETSSKTTVTPAPVAECRVPRSKDVCAWLHSGTRLDAMPSWLRQRLPSVPSWTDVRQCPREEEGEEELELRAEAPAAPGESVPS